MRLDVDMQKGVFDIVAVSCNMCTIWRVITVSWGKLIDEYIFVRPLATCIRNLVIQAWSLGMPHTATTQLVV